MKYFLYDLLIAQNRDDISEEELNRVDKEWQRNEAEYHEVFKILSDRLPQDVFKHFSSWGFHDYRLIKIEIQHKSLRHVIVHFTISCNAEKEEDNKLWMLSFEDVSFFEMQHYNYDNPTPIFHPDMDDWLYEEFIPINQSTISFEVLFSSGGNVKLRFPDKSVSIKRFK
ncbi:hypothetical protein [Niallia sp. 03190]|uniref:hypothetical protein n=1 Tax=Niallia sp. 03190 TaxID=3458061 RepID=UPI004043E2D4